MGEQAIVDMNATCPFGGDACLVKAVRFDSGLLSSNDDVGINSPLQQSLQFRRVTTCAPIRVDRYATEWRENLTQAYYQRNDTTTSAKFFEFGRSDTGCIATPLTQQTPSTTFCISQWMKDNLPGAYDVT
jgi:hypothetical protein